VEDLITKDYAPAVSKDGFTPAHVI